MKKITFSMLFASALFVASCSNNSPSKEPIPSGEHSHEGHEHGKEEHSGHEHEAYFTCAQHPDVHEHSAGKCPKCSNDLIQQEGEAHEHEGHKHEAYYTCADHPGVHEHDMGQCPKCKKDLVKKDGESH
jgi:ssDNA-binding Zn-finger/Zn-ribbon topoisomerase 1